MKFTIYTTNWCSYCKATKQLLISIGFDFSEINLEEKGMDREDLFELTGGRTVPQILMNGNPIGGFDDLQKLHASGKLTENIHLTN